MGVIATWDRITEYAGQAQGSTARFLADHEVPVIDTAVTATCTLAQNYPKTLLKGKYINSLLDSMCPLFNEPLPDAPPRAFDGGQCPGTEYEILIEGERRFNQDPPTPQSTRIVAFGPIDDIFLGRNSPVNDPRILTIQVFARDAAGNEKFFGDPYGGVGVEGEIISISISTLDGSVDNCGNTGGGFPEDPAYNPVDGKIVIDGQEYDFDFDGFDGTEFCFESDELIICITPDGVDIRQKPKTEEIPFDPELFDEDDSECTPPEDVQAEANGEEPEGVEVCEGETEELKWLLIKIVGQPDTGQHIQHPNPEDDVYFAGYLAWYILNGGVKYFLPSIPIRKKANAFRPPVDVNGYNVYTVNSTKLSIKELKGKATNA